MTPDVYGLAYGGEGGVYGLVFVGPSGFAVPGIELRLPSQRPHFTLTPERPQFALSKLRPHFVVREE